LKEVADGFFVTGRTTTAALLRIFLFFPRGSPAAFVFIPAGFSWNPRVPCHPLPMLLSIREPTNNEEEWDTKGNGSETERKGQKRGRSDPCLNEDYDDDFMLIYEVVRQLGSYMCT